MSDHADKPKDVPNDVWEAADLAVWGNSTPEEAVAYSIIAERKRLSSKIDQQALVIRGLVDQIAHIELGMALNRDCTQALSNLYASAQKASQEIARAAIAKTLP